MLIAVIDLGTNTFNLLVAEVFPNKSFKELYNAKTPVKLGEGGINKNFIAPAPFQRGLEALRIYANKIKDFKVNKTVAFATSAIRSASNGSAFIQEAKKETGLTIQIIQGEEEAELIYYGVKQALSFQKYNSLIMDIGGGSIEFVIANEEKILRKHSFDLGAARLLEKFQPSDPIKSNEIATIENYLKQQTLPLHQGILKFPVEELIGSSGSFDTFAEIICHQFHETIDFNVNTSYDFNLVNYYYIHEKLLSSTKKERLNTKGLIEMRVDMIVIASIFVNFVLQQFTIKKMRLSTYSLKEGILWKLTHSSLLNH